MLKSRTRDTPWIKVTKQFEIPPGRPRSRPSPTGDRKKWIFEIFYGHGHTDLVVDRPQHVPTPLCRAFCDVRLPSIDRLLLPTSEQGSTVDLALFRPRGFLILELRGGR